MGYQDHVSTKTKPTFIRIIVTELTNTDATIVGVIFTNNKKRIKIMGREVRFVPKDWEHPQIDNGWYRPLLYDYNEYIKPHKEAQAKWEQGLYFCPEQDCYIPKKEEYKGMSYEDWHGELYSMDDFMSYYYVGWEDAPKDHLQMYENTSEGTPISPVFDNADDLAQWLADNDASAFGTLTTTKAEWLETINRGSVPSMVITHGKITSGVSASVDDNVIIEHLDNGRIRIEFLPAELTNVSAPVNLNGDTGEITIKTKSISGVCFLGNVPI